jgi:tetratricopeptide (TPR) repeat protein
MTILKRNLLVATVMVVALFTTGLYYVYNSERQAIEQQAGISLNRGIALFHQKKYTESLQTLQTIPDGVLSNWRLPYFTGSAQVMLKDYQPAVLELENALRLNSQEPKILFALGVAYYKLGELGLSKGYFAAVLEVDPTNDEAKGLMDIMATLERQQSATTPEEKSQNNDTGADGH